MRAARVPFRPRARGFTLIEVLVALVVMALMSVMAWRAVSALTTSRDVNEAHMDQAETLYTLMRQWELDMREVQESRQVTALAFDGASLRLTRRTADGMQMVVWRLSGGRLVRWASPTFTTLSALQDAWFHGQQLGDQELANSPGVRGAIGWQMYFFRNNAWSNAQSSADDATDSKTVSTPSGVRMKIQFNGEGGFQGELNREVIVPAGGTR